MTRNLMITTAMTPLEAKAGRFMRAPDHPTDSGAPMVDLEEAPEAKVPTPPAKSTDDLYDEEYAGTVDGDDGKDGEDGEDDALELKNVVIEEGDEKPEEKPEEKPVNDVQKRIDDMTAELRETQRQLAEERRQREEASKPKGEEETPQEDGPPNPEDYEFGKADDKFIADWSRWNADQRFDERQRASQAEAEIEALETGWKGAIEQPDVVELYPDFDDKVTKGADRKDWACSPTMAVLIKRSDVGAHVAYELATNPDESRRIAALSPNEQLLEIGRLEGRMSAKVSASSVEQPATKKATQAPPPPEARARGQGGKFAKAEDAMYDRMLAEFD
jgi:hypothetical protein